MIVSQEEIKTKFSEPGQFQDANCLQFAHCMRSLLNEDNLTKLNQENNFIKYVNFILDIKSDQAIKFPDYSIVATNESEKVNNLIQSVYSDDLI